MKRPIVVTGAAGFIGSHVAKALLESGRPVVGIDSLDPYYSSALKKYNLSLLRPFPGWRFYKSDIRLFDSLAKIMTEVRPEYVIHLAARAGVRASIADPRAYVETNVLGTMNVLEAARAVGVKKLLIASSSSVYGNDTKAPFREDASALMPASPYAASKRATELLAQNYSEIHKLPIQMFRFFTVYGPSGRPDMAPALFTKAILNGKPISIFGSDQTLRDYTYIDDIVAGLLAALPTKELFGIYNLGNSKPEPLHELIRSIEQHSGKVAKKKMASIAPGDVDQTWANISKAREKFGYHPTTELNSGIKQFVEWYQKHRHFYEES